MEGESSLFPGCKHNSLCFLCLRACASVCLCAGRAYIAKCMLSQMLYKMRTLSAIN